ncbi:lectin beta-1 and beta-2 chains-like [Vicia villosa]|uniref:lectin beta-1 and beta-2 chains-like n=1 Tax=Vicia villosa TaxID=3911 RepID=UPI00273CE8DE|nr:lectin beta-1 and beta-2 chains-like [Vicia villosa]
MATTQISFCVTVLSISLATLFFFQVNSTETETTSFSIPKFVSDQPNLIFQGTAYTSNERVYLTKREENDVGRVLYSAPIHIWDSKTGNVADFNTSFHFSIDAVGSPIADGIAFFLAPVDTKPGGPGGFLGLFNSKEYNKTVQTVAVEFDTYKNAWDPSDPHIGIDVNSIESKSTVPWTLYTDRWTEVEISFKAATSELSVLLTYPYTPGEFTHSEIVVLKDVLPEWVRVGLSASTGLDYAPHEVYSWSFHSELKLSSNQVAAA